MITVYLYDHLGHFLTELQIEADKSHKATTRAPRLIIRRGRYFCLTEALGVQYIEATPVTVE